MPTFEELLDDRKQFPDETKVTVSGVEVTLGSLRSGYMKDADYRRKGSKLAEERRQLEAEKTAFESERLTAEQKLEALATSVLRQNPQMTRDEVQEELESNPAAKRLMGEIDGLKKQFKDVTEALNVTKQELEQQKVARNVEQHQRVLSVLKAHDPSLDTEELIEYCKREHIPRLDHGYRLMTEEKRVGAMVAKAKEEAKKEGIEEGKRVATQVSIPQRRMVSTLLPENAPKTFDEAAAAAEQDPEIISLLAGQG